MKAYKPQARGRGGKGARLAHLNFGRLAAPGHQPEHAPEPKAATASGTGRKAVVPLGGTPSQARSPRSPSAEEQARWFTPGRSHAPTLTLAAALTNLADDGRKIEPRRAPPGRKIPRTACRVVVGPLSIPARVALGRRLIWFSDSAAPCSRVPSGSGGFMNGGTAPAVHK